MNKKTPQKKICRSYATCPDHTCDSCNANPYASACGPTTLDGAGNPIPQATKPDSITPELLPPETNALTHSRTNELATTSHSPGEVVAQYRLAVAGTLEMLRFGAMLVEVDSDLNRSTHKGGCFQDGDTLKAWLADNCPSVNYNTAMRFKRLAEGLKREFKIPAKMRLTDALPEADGSLSASTDVIEVSRERVIEVRAEIWEFVNGKSARQLMFDFGLAERKTQGGSREGSGRPTKSAEEKLDLDGEISRKVILGNIDPLREEVLHRRGWMRISDDRLETMRTLLKEVVTKMSDELERRGRAKKFGR